MEFHQNLLKEINELRSNPSSFADKLLGYKSYFINNIIKFPNSKVGMQTEEGFTAYEEAANYLKTLSPICEMNASKGLCKVAKEYLDKVAQCGVAEIDSIDLSSIIKKYGKFKGTFGSAMEFRSDIPELVAANLVACDGDASRANRDLLLNPELKKIGIANGAHPEYGNVTIILSSTEFLNKVDENDIENFC